MRDERCETNGARQTVRDKRCEMKQCEMKQCECVLSAGADSMASIHEFVLCTTPGRGWDQDEDEDENGYQDQDQDDQEQTQQQKINI